jgi:hypothetical protein
MARRCLETPSPPKAPKIRIKMIGNKILNTMEAGLEKIALKLAFVIAQKARDWL